MLGEWENKVNGYTSYLGGGGSKGRNTKQEGKQLEIKIELVSYTWYSSPDPNFPYNHKVSLALANMSFKNLTFLYWSSKRGKRAQ